MKHLITLVITCVLCAACGAPPVVPSDTSNDPPAKAGTAADPNVDNTSAVATVHCAQNGTLNADPNAPYRATLDVIPHYVGRVYATLTVTDTRPVVAPRVQPSAITHVMLPQVPATVLVPFQAHDFTATIYRSADGIYTWHVEVTTPNEVLWPVTGGAPSCQ